MEQPKYLIDTNAVIDYLGEKLPTSRMSFWGNVIDIIPNISVITKIKLLGFNAAGEHYQTLIDFVNDAVVLDLTSNVVTASIDIRKNQKTKLPDAIIAATGVVYGLKLITRNIADFKNIPGLDLINPWEL
ncbi:MAG: type II toxin-antitoxin system VapC family toxin [Chitinophagaceae bacterium]|nr:MAG: type II toxin-antitoxin system VapC family toxin [Chitinophagaceae bacterium]